MAEQIELLPGLFVDLDAFSRHGSPFMLHVPEQWAPALPDETAVG
jgi:hypothetical protein